jgi:hypothetical protein
MVPPDSGGITKRKKWTIAYSNIPSALRRVLHGEEISVPEPPKEYTIDSDDEDKGESTSNSPETPAST